MSDTYYNTAIAVLINQEMKQAFGTLPSIRVFRKGVQKTAQRVPGEAEEGQGLQNLTGVAPVPPPKKPTDADRLVEQLQRQHPYAVEQDPQLSYDRSIAHHRGNWLLSDGTYTGHVDNHDESAIQIMKKLGLPGEGFALMSRSGAIRVRYLGNEYLAVDMVGRPTSAQIAKIMQKAIDVERSGGTFVWSVLADNDMGELASGTGIRSLRQVDWDQVDEDRKRIQQEAG